jgi:hypothetical protein
MIGTQLSSKPIVAHKTLESQGKRDVTTSFSKFRKINLFTSSRKTNRTRQLMPGPVSLINPGAGDGARTRDLQLGRLELYQLSYTRILY